jgi:putative DNA primase/helicase
MADELDRVFAAAAELGLEVDTFNLDGEWHRCAIAGKKKGNQSGTYCLSEFVLRDGRRVVVGLLNNYVSGVEERLTLKGIEGVSAEEAAESRRRLREAAEQSRKARELLQADTAARASALWTKLPDSGRSPYLDRKGVKAWGVRFSRGSIVVPARDAAGQLSTLQFIDPEGAKRFLTGGAKRGRFHLIGSPPEGRHLLGVGEGYATCATVHEATRISIAVAFDAGNLLPVAAALKGVYPLSTITVFADNDLYNGYPQAFIREGEASPAVRSQIARLAARRADVLVEIVANDDPRLKDRDSSHNVGVASAILAAAAVDGEVIVPRFSEGEA